MINQADRSSIKVYFYGSNGPLLLATLGPVALVLLSILFHIPPLAAIIIILLALLAALIWALIERFAPNQTAERQYDHQLELDIEQLRSRALEKLGLVSEQISMIEPIRVRGPYYDFHLYSQKNKNRSKILSFLFLILKIYFWYIYLPFIGIRAVVTKKRYRPRLIFRYGSDYDTRYSMVEVNIFLFSENQVYVYTCSYDMCFGEIYEEKTAEYFYQDIDCVITGARVEKILSKKEMVSKTFEYFKLIVTSGTSTSAIADGASILNTQVRGMRELIRSKKEELML